MQQWIMISGLFLLFLHGCSDGKSLPLKCGDPTWEPGEKWELNTKDREDNEEDEQRTY